MLMDKMLDGKKKRRLNKAYNRFWEFCMICCNADNTLKTSNTLDAMIKTQFDNLVLQIKEAYDVCD